MVEWDKVYDIIGLMLVIRGEFEVDSLINKFSWEIYYEKGSIVLRISWVVCFLYK